MYYLNNVHKIQKIDLSQEVNHDQGVALVLPWSGLTQTPLSSHN